MHADVRGGWDSRAIWVDRGNIGILVVWDNRGILVVWGNRVIRADGADHTLMLGCL